MGEAIRRMLEEAGPEEVETYGPRKPGRPKRARLGGGQQPRFDVEAFVHNNKISKVERYKWSQVGPWGESRDIHKSQLQIDYDYQRDGIPGKAKAIAKNFSPMAFGVLLVSMRPDGSCFVYDGQNRLIAAMLRSDVEEVPCRVFTFKDQKAEAEAFLQANINRKNVAAYDKFRAQLVAEDEAAIFVYEMVEKSDATFAKVARRPREVACVKTLRQLAAINREMMAELWPLIVDCAERHPIMQHVVEGMFYAENRLRKQDISLLKKPWRDVVIRHGMEAMERAAIANVGMLAKGGARVWAEGIVNLLNKGKHGINRLDLFPDRDED